MPFPVVSFMKRELIITFFNALLFYLIFNILPNFHKKMSSGEDDYMSNDLLNKISDVKPGVSSSRNAQRMLRISQNAEKQRSERAPTKEQAEKTRLEEGIQKPIGSDTKGFKLLSMMGYKPGMSLGRARESQPEGIKEPIQMQMKTGRTGLGLDEENRLKQKQICEAHMAQMKHRARMEESLADDYRSRRRFLASQKEIISDIRRMQRACQELDIRNGKEMPEDFWFWPIYSSRSDPETGKLLAAVEQADDDADEDGPTGLKRRRIVDEKIAEEVPQEVQYHYSTGKPAPMNLNLYELDEQQLNQNLEQMVAYMRDNHFYCIWCGCSYEDEEDLSTNCPGTTRSEHEE